MKKRHFITLLVLLVLAALVFWVPREMALRAPGEVRAALDIGSGATNLKVAKIDPKTDQIVAVLFQKSIEVPFQKELEKSHDQTFNAGVMERGIGAIKELKTLADQHGAKKVVAVATAAFRKALNAAEFAQNIEKQTGVHVRIIEQDEEGILAFRGALASKKMDPSQAVVWDIGGGSMQLTTLSDQGSYLIDKGRTASALFKNALIEQVKKQDPRVVHSPNPMSAAEMDAGLKIAAQLSESTAPFIQEKIHRTGTQVLAVGNLFNYSVLPLVKGTTIQREALHKGTFAMAGKTDKELPGGAFSDVSVSNPLMVLGYMTGLDIHHVEVVEVNNTDGVLTFAPYWQ